jgi:hypothetical protein
MGGHLLFRATLRVRLKRMISRTYTEASVSGDVIARGFS